MSSYLSYFSIKYKTGLQYRLVALAGLSTQFFFGFIYVLIYIAFFKSGSSNSPMTLSEVVSYLWLQQAFFAFIYMHYKDKDIVNMIKNGNVAYELTKPQDIYFMWAFKIYGERLSQLTLRFSPVLIVASLLPEPYKLHLEVSIVSLVLFIISLVLASILIVFLLLLIHILCMFTLDDKGIMNILLVIADIFSGVVLPIPFFPTIVQRILDFLPFKYVSDFVFRIYIGNIPHNEAIMGILVQIIWILILFIAGKLLLRKALKNAIIQGG